MIEKLSVQLYPYIHYDENQRTDLYNVLHNTGIKNIEVTTDIKNNWNLNEFSITGVHSNQYDVNATDEIVPSLIHEGDFIFPISSMAQVVGRNSLKYVGNLIFRNRFRRLFFHQTKLKNYFKKEYWIELACWLNSQNKKIILHNHGLELHEFVDGESPWEIIHRYTTPNIRFQFDPQNLPNPFDLEDLLIRYHQRIDSIHLDLDDPKLTNEEKETVVEFSKVISRPVNLIIEQTNPDLKKLEKQIKKLKQLI